MKDSARRAMFANMKKSSKPITAYDVKAREKARMLDPKIVTIHNHKTKTNMIAWSGKSAKTGIPMFKIIGKNC